MSELLQIHKLSVDYCRRGSEPACALRDVSLAIDPGEVVGVMGESGCGKTTLANAILGLLPHKRTRVSGSIRFRGEEMLAMPESELREIRGAGISMVYQEPESALSPFLRVGEQVADVVRAHRKWNWNRCHDAAFALIQQMGFDEPERICRSYSHQLSGGQRQRIVFAQALVCEPALIIADEPTASLDARTQAEVIKLLGEIRRQRNVSVLLISHTPEVQASLADRLIVMSQGRVIEEGAFDRLYWDPSHEITKMMLHPEQTRRARKGQASTMHAPSVLEAHEEAVR